MELWRDIPGYEGLYQASSFGRIRGMKRGKVLSPSASNGYLAVNICKGGKVVCRRVHTLVALAFIGPRPEGLQVRHLDCDKKNNKPSNLKYGTEYENYLDSYRAGRFKHMPIGERTKSRIRRLLLSGSMTQREISASLGVSPQTVSRLNRKLQGPVVIPL